MNKNLEEMNKTLFIQIEKIKAVAGEELVCQKGTENVKCCPRCISPIYWVGDMKKPNFCPVCGQPIR